MWNLLYTSDVKLKMLKWRWFFTHLKCTWMNILITTCFFHMKEIVKNQFNIHLLVEMIFYKDSPAFYMIEIVITTCSLRWFLCSWIVFLWFLHLCLVLLLLINLIENYKIKYLPWGLNPEIHNRNGFLKNEKFFSVTGDWTQNLHPPSPPAIPLAHRRTIQHLNMLYIWTLRPRLLASNSSLYTTDAGVMICKA